MFEDSKKERSRELGREDIDISKIRPDPEQPRKQFSKEDIERLAENIKSNGILVPLVVMPSGPDKKGEYLLIDGERRHRAAKKIDLKKVPCMIMRKVEGFNLDILRFAIHHQREDWTPFEKADKLYQMKETYGKSLDEISREVGISVQTIRQYLKTRELPQSVRDRAQKNRKKFKMSYLTEMVGVTKNLDPKWQAEFKDPEDIIAKKVEDKIIKSPIELRRLRHVFKKNNPVVIRRFFGDEEYTAEDAYIQSGRASEDFEKDLYDATKHLTGSMSDAFKRDLYMHADRNLVKAMKELLDILQQFVDLYEEKQEESLKKRKRLKAFEEETGIKIT